MIADRGLGPDHLVVEAASNDGYLLKAFLERGIGVLGIDPADGQVMAARQKGVETIHDFFTAELAEEMVRQGLKADLFLANNVLAHVPNTNDFVQGIETLLSPEGIAVIEAPYLLDLVDHGAFDTIYHQHLLYLSLTALVPLFARHVLHLNDAERIRVHGGSLRLFVSRDPGKSPRLARLLAEEDRRRVGSPEFFDKFLKKIARMRNDTREAISSLVYEGKTVAAYGAAAKGTTLLHYFGLGADEISFIVDRSPFKQGMEMPGTRIPIIAPQALAERAPDAVLILAWNFANEIVAENRAVADAGGKFLIPVPEFHMVADELVGVSL